VIVVPVVIITTMFVVQYALAYYARQVLAGATQDGAAAGARQGSTPDAGAALADALIDQAGSSMLRSHTVSATSDGTTVTVRASGRVVALLPFLGGITVKAAASATIERFDPQGDSG
jgi:Flp pilus assembly protein TadG